jgi:hypothetical protein
VSIQAAGSGGFRQHVPAQPSPTVSKGSIMLKKIIAAVVVGAVAKVVLDKLTKADKDAELWAEATDKVEAGR